MAFLVVGAIHQTIKGVQSGIQAHKDFKANTDPQPSGSNQTTSEGQASRAEAPLDRYGRPKERHPVYGWVMKAEHKFNKGKGKGREISQDAGPSTVPSTDNQDDEERGARKLNKEEMELEQYRSTKTSERHDEAAPPSYEAAVSAPIATASAEDHHTRSADVPYTRIDDSAKTQRAPIATGTSYGSMSSDSSASISDNDQRATGDLSTRRARKNERRVRKAEKRLDRAKAHAARKSWNGAYLVHG